ncbi:hypothetical protein SKAU_G00196610 [Synaphobranchus kaupii]|uniref:Uncharacterized protein n=1 Tax=Synaphobranchus kaupii TaxID=118154 RepID=A0A9Q1FEU5_SYNKA|nr:hypothetical protein SKAU_G00196610 [Synaphobranchus kaupii]
MNKFAAACFGVMVLAICSTQVGSQNTTDATPTANQTQASASVNVTTMATNTLSSATNITTPSRADFALQPATCFVLIAMAISLLHCC